MYYTGINPLDMKPVYVVTDYHEKQLQRALLQYNRPENADLVREALTRAGREELIGFGEECLVRPAGARGGQGRKPGLGKAQSGGARLQGGARKIAQAETKSRGRSDRKAMRQSREMKSRPRKRVWQIRKRREIIKNTNKSILLYR